MMFLCLHYCFAGIPDEPDIEESINFLCHNIPSDKFYDFCLQLGIHYTYANHALVKNGNDYVAAAREIMNEWKNGVEANSGKEYVDLLKAALAACNLNGIAGSL